MKKNENSSADLTTTKKRFLKGARAQIFPPIYFFEFGKEKFKDQLLPKRHTKSPRFRDKTHWNKPSGLQAFVCFKTDLSLQLLAINGATLVKLRLGISHGIRTQFNTIKPTTWSFAPDVVPWGSKGLRLQKEHNLAGHTFCEIFAFNVLRKYGVTKE